MAKVGIADGVEAGDTREAVGRLIVDDVAELVVAVCLCGASLGSRNRLIERGTDLCFAGAFIEEGFDDDNDNDGDDDDDVDGNGDDVDTGEGEDGSVVGGGGNGDVDDEDVGSRRWVCCCGRSL